MKPLERFHKSVIHEHRVQALAAALAGLLPPNRRCLDVGCGDGLIVQRVQKLRPDLAMTGVETRARKDAVIPVQTYDGKEIPFPAGAFDIVMLIDVLHHSEDIGMLLGEARRVARECVLVKDHVAASPVDRLTLSAMDWMANRRFGFPLRYNYLARGAWEAHFRDAGLEVASWSWHLRLYPWPVTLCCDRSLHFLALFNKR